MGFVVWVFGLWVAQQHLLVVGSAVFVIFFSCWWLLQKKYKATVGFIVVCLMLFVGAQGYVFLRRVNHPWHLPLPWVQRDLVVEGEIVSIPRHGVHADRFVVSVSTLQGKPIQTRIQVSWYGKHPPLVVGDVWRWVVRLKPPHGLSNPGGFDWRAWYQQHHIAATGYIVGSRSTTFVHHMDDHRLLLFRQQTAGYIQRVIVQPQLSSIIAALTLGVREPLSKSQWLVFQHTGTSHLMAVSGLHIVLIAMVVYRICFWLWCRFPGLLFIVPAPYVASVCSMAAAVGYALVSGWGLPAQRACIMLLVMLFGQCWSCHYSIWRRIQVAFIIVLTLTPSAIVSASFWLSMFAVSWIGYALWGCTFAGSRLWQWGRVQFVLFMGLLPLNLYLFSQVSWVSGLANAVAIPWVSFFVLPLSLLAVIVSTFSLWMGGFLLQVVAWVLAPLWWLLVAMGSWHGMVWQHNLSSIFICCLFLLAMLLLLAPKGFVGRGFGLVMLLPLLFPSYQRPDEGDVWLTVLDVGQGLATVLQTANHVLLYDTGPHAYGGFDAGKSVVLPYLQYLGEDHVDLMMVSHGDNDHAGGASAILSAIPVATILTSAPAKLIAWHSTKCYQGQHWEWDGVSFEVLWPRQVMPYRGNNSSCVLKVTAHNKSILLPGDIEKSAELALVQEKSKDLQADVLVAPHHGSNTSSSLVFIETVKPHVVIYSQGYYNRFHFPSPRVVERYLQEGIVQYKTSLSGAIIVRLIHEGAVELTAFMKQP